MRKSGCNSHSAEFFHSNIQELSVHQTTPKLEKRSLSLLWLDPISVYEIENEAWEQMGTFVLLIACFVRQPDSARHSYSGLILQLSCKRKTVSANFTEQADLLGKRPPF